MNTTRLHPMAEDYLERLEVAARVLPDQDRHDLVAELRGHLAAGLDEAASDAEVRNLLDDLGSPADIVAAAAPQDETGTPLPQVPTRPADVGPAASPWGALEILAVFGLTVGAFVVPILAPIVGLVLAWASTRWSRREKVVASLLTVLPLVALALGAAVFTASGPSHPVPVSPTPQHSLGGSR